MDTAPTQPRNWYRDNMTSWVISCFFEGSAIPYLLGIIEREENGMI